MTSLATLVSSETFPLRDELLQALAAITPPRSHRAWAAAHADHPWARQRQDRLHLEQLGARGRALWKEPLRRDGAEDGDPRSQHRPCGRQDGVLARKRSWTARFQAATWPARPTRALPPRKRRSRGCGRRTPSGCQSLGLLLVLPMRRPSSTSSSSASRSGALPSALALQEPQKPRENADVLAFFSGLRRSVTFCNGLFSLSLGAEGSFS